MPCHVLHCCWVLVHRQRCHLPADGKQCLQAQKGSALQEQATQGERPHWGVQTRSQQGCTLSPLCLVRCQSCSGAYRASKQLHGACLVQGVMCGVLAHVCLAASGIERLWQFMYCQIERGQGPDGLAALGRVGPEAAQRSGKGHEGTWSVPEAAGRRRLLGGCQGNPLYFHALTRAISACKGRMAEDMVSLRQSEPEL